MKKLSPVMRTSLSTLYMRACENLKKHPIVHDKNAQKAVDMIDFDFSNTFVGMNFSLLQNIVCIRTKQMDDIACEFLQKYPQNSCVVYLGCGLDDRYGRIIKNEVIFVNLDYKEIIEIRDKIYKYGSTHVNISCSFTDVKWITQLEEILEKNKVINPILFIAEGLLMYIKEDDIKDIIEVLSSKFCGSIFAFDIFSKKNKQIVEKKSPVISSTNASLEFTLDNPYDLERWYKKNTIKVVKEHYVMDYINFFKFDCCFLYLWCCFCIPCFGKCYFKGVKRLHRIVVLEFTQNINVNKYT